MPLTGNDTILSISGISKRFKGLVAVSNVSFDVKRGSITALIGPNGAGKTTLFNLISGFLKNDSGSILFNGNHIERLPPHRRSRLGVVRTFQIPRIFGRLTVLENLMVADPSQPGEEPLGCFWRNAAMRRRQKEVREKADGLINLLNLSSVGDTYGAALSGGQRKLVELGRVLMTGPTMIMLDEPMAGVNPALGLRLLERVQQLRAERGITFLFVEHDMDIVMQASDRVLVLDEGQLIADGLPKEIRANERVIDAYLGRAAVPARVSA
jgi:ABC-type branched-subunit amino acid transport system ATPase component